MKSKKNEKPTFIYAVTMQNHGPYLDTRYGDNTEKIVDSYSSETNQILNTYGTGIIHSDNALHSLFDTLGSLKEPTLVVFFGDHLPALGNVYNELNYKSNNFLEQELNMKKTPLVVWNNFDKEIDEIGAISSSFLAPKIMEWAELDSPSYYSFLSNFSKLLPGYTSVVKLSGEGDLFTETPKELSEKEYISINSI
ncbi:sulfatase-like hydrolase/transferase [Ureibacillus sp. FSL W8-0352]|uniref:sulfatase-like hydrolase/transferase n=1 Tax=Ureibacillus sp. FSL W8-0352 TaxID=2954596 RepID=UPI0030F6BD54